MAVIEHKHLREICSHLFVFLESLDFCNVSVEVEPEMINALLSSPGATSLEVMVQLQADLEQLKHSPFWCPFQQQLILQCKGDTSSRSWHTYNHRPATSSPDVWSYRYRVLRADRQDSFPVNGPSPPFAQVTAIVEVMKNNFPKPLPKRDPKWF